MDRKPSLRKTIFWGATGQAKVLRECLKHAGIELVALFDNREGVEHPFPDVPLHFGQKGFAEWLAGRDTSEHVGFLVAIGGSRGKDRIQIHEYLESHGLEPLIAVHPTAFVAEDSQIGAGSQILAQAAVCVEAVLGRSCIVNTGATVDHECRLGDGVHVCPGAHLAGCVEVGHFAMIGTGAAVLPRIRIGEGAVVGAGAVVIRDVPPGAVVVGNPAKEKG